MPLCLVWLISVRGFVAEVFVREQIAAHVVRDGFGERGASAGEARGPELRHVGAGVVLVLAFEDLRHVDVFDPARLLHGVEDGGNKLVPGLGEAASGVVDAAQIRTVEQEEDHLHDVLHIHEIAFLLAVGVLGAAGLEELHGPGVANLLERAADHAAHRPLVAFVRAEDVGELHARDGVHEAVADRPQVEHLLGVAVHVQRTERRDAVERVGVALFARAVGGGAGGVDEPDAARRAERGEELGVFEIVVDEVGGVELGRGRARAEMDDRLHIGGQAVRGELADEVVLLHVVGVAERAEVFPFFGLAEVVDDQDVVDAPAVEPPDDGAADESGRARDDVLGVRDAHEIGESGLLLVTSCR